MTIDDITAQTLLSMCERLADGDQHGIGYTHAAELAARLRLSMAPARLDPAPSDHKPGCVGNGLGAANDPAAVAKAQDELTERGMRDA